ncbi:MAG: hypothetical protein GY719_04980 [bacterium]|nr:hypothetical protein [bacterium]
MNTHHGSRQTLALLLGLLVAPAALAAVPFDAEITLVPEMEDPAGIVAEPRREREALQDNTEARRGLDLLRQQVTGLWPRIREIDLVELSRYQVEQTRGFELPAAPGELTGRVLANDEESGLWHLELRGPRLPARFDIVYRFLHVFATFDPATGEIDRLTVTIRGWVEE